jgi:hypothetical protein
MRRRADPPADQDQIRLTAAHRHNPHPFVSSMPPT